MKKKIDNLGRIVIPIEVRRDLNLNLGEELNMEVVDNKIILSKQHSICAICGSSDVWYKVKDQGLCKECFKQIKAIKELDN